MTGGPPASHPAPGGGGTRALLLIGGLALGLAALGAWLWLRSPAPRPRAGRDFTAEARINVLKLCADVQSYWDTHGVPLSAGPTPAEVPEGYAVPWPEDAAFQALGFEPGPRVRYQYEVVVALDPVGEPEVTCVARGDLDGDGQNSVFRVTLDAHGQTSALQVEREHE